MKTLSPSKFETLFSNGISEHFGGDEFTFINYEDDEFYFYYNADQENFEGQGIYKLTEDQQERIARAINEKYQEHIEENKDLENTPFSVDYYEMYGVSESMFI